MAGDTKFVRQRKVLHDITAIGDGRKVVTAAATAETLVASSTACQKLDIQAETDNTGLIAVGTSTVVAAEGTQRGIILQAGDVYSIEIDDLVEVYVDATVSGDGVTFTYYT